MPSSAAVFLSLASLVPFGIGTVSLLFGARRGYDAFRHLSGAHPETTPTPVSPAAVTDGRAAVTGEVGPGPEGTVTAPLSGTEAVAYRLRIEQRDDRGEWVTVAEYDDAARFYLEGPVDRLLVEPSGAEPTIEATTTLETGRDDSLPADVRSRLEATDRIDPAASPAVLATATDEQRRYSEAVLEPGETAYVYGDCDEEAGPPAHVGSARIDGAESASFRFGTEAAVAQADDRSVSDSAATLLLVLQGAVSVLFGLFFLGVGAVVVSDAMSLALIGVAR